MQKKITTFVLVGYLSLTACSPIPLLPDSYVNEQIKNISAGSTGCRPEELQILEKKGFDTISLLPTMQTWVVSCKGEKFICSSSTSCKELK